MRLYSCRDTSIRLIKYLRFERKSFRIHNIMVNVCAQNDISNNIIEHFWY